MNRGIVTGDLFGDLEDGYYAINASISSGVENIPCEYGILMKMTSNYGYAVMKAFNVLNNSEYTTVKNNQSTWTSWKQNQEAEKPPK